MHHRRLVLLCAVTVALAVLALIVVTLPARPLELEPVRTVPPTTTVPAPPIVGRSSELRRFEETAAIAHAVEQNDADAKARWYTEVARQAAETAAAAPAPRAKPAPSSSPPAAPAPRGSGDAATAIATYFGDIYDQAWGVSGCESGHDPGAISPGGGNWGLFQINRGAHQADFVQFAGVLLDDEHAPPDDPRRTWAGGVLNADLNAAYARKMYNGSGWGPWSCAWAA